MKTKTRTIRRTRWWSGLAAAAILGLASTNGSAQSASTYSFSATSGTYTELASGTDLTGARVDSYLSPAQSIGFNFVYEGTTYTQFKMSSDGYITLNMAATSTILTNDLSTANATSRPIIAPLWDDLDGNVSSPSTSVARYAVGGTAPNRVLTVEWRYWQWNWSATGNTISFQVKLYETSNAIEFVYRQESGAVNSGSATIGIGSATGSGSGSYLNLTSIASPAVSSTSSVINLNTKPATGQVYRFDPPAPCSGTPNAGTASGPASVCSGSTASLSATGLSTDTGISFQWEESPNGVSSWADVVGGSGATTPNYTTTAINATRYFRIKTTCSNSGLDNVSNVVTVNVLSPTYAVYDGVSYTESFENTWTNGCATKDLPNTSWKNTPATGHNTWRRNDDITSGGWQYTSGGMYSPASFAGTYSARFHSYGAASGLQGSLDLYLDMSGASGSEELKFNYINPTGTDVLAVLVSTDGGANFTAVGGNVGAVASWTEATRTITSTSSTTVIRFRATSDFGDNDIGLDNVRLAAPPSCITPTGVTPANITSSAADISWTCSGCTGSYIVEYGATGFTPGTDGNAGVGGTIWTGGPVAGSPATITGLSASTAYQVYVRQVCPGPDYSGNSTVAAFTTPCAAVNVPYTQDFESAVTPAMPSCWTVENVNGSNTWITNSTTVIGTGKGARYPWNGSTAADDWMYSPGFNLVGGTSYTLSYDYGANGFNEALEVYYGTSAASASMTTLIVDHGTFDDGPHSVSYTFTPAASGVYYIGWHAYSDANMFNLEVDNIGLMETPSCSIPAAVGASNITFTAADISWTCSGCTGSYIVEYGATGFTPGTDGNAGVGGTIWTGGPVAGSPVTITGLSASTAYQVYVRQVCPGPDYSPNSSVANFSTLYDCDAAAIAIPSLPVSNQAVACGGANNLNSTTVPATCGSASNNYKGGQEALYTFVPTTTGLHTISYSGVSWTGIFLYANACPNAGGTCVGSASSSSTTNSLSANLTAGITYYLWIDTYPTPNSPCPGTFSITTPQPPPANDECAGAVALTVNPDYACGSVTSGTVAAATASAGATGCFGTADDDVWYSFTATGAAHRVSLTNIVGSTTDMYMAFYSGSCGALNNIYCSDPNEANLTGLTAGLTYYVRVYTYTSTPGQTTTFDICVGTPPPPPANDECAGAVALTVNPDYACGSVTSGTVAAATASAGATGCFGTADDDVWYSFTATGAAHRVSLTNIVGSTTDMYMAFYSGSCGALSNIYCSDPNEANLTGLTAGLTYYVRVYTYTSTPGQTTTFDVCVGTPPPPPTCPGGLGPNTVNIASLPYSTTGQTTCGSGNNITSTNVGITCGSTNYYGGEDRTYIFTATESGVYNIDLATGADQDAGMTVFHGCPFDPASTCMGAAQSLSGLTRSLTPTLTAGETYYVVVDNWPSPSCLSSYDLSITAPPPCLGNQVVVNITTDYWYGETSWEIVDAGNNVIASGAPATGNALNSTVACLGNTPGPAWYGFRIMDSYGDGMSEDANAKWELRTTDGKLIMGDAFSDGASSPANPPLAGSYGSHHSFALPLAAPDVHPAECGVFDNRSDNKVFANKVAGTNYLGGTLNYQFEFSDPDSGFIRRIKKPRNYIVFSELNPSPLKGGKHYFTRVRTDKAGPVADAHWGAGCEMGLGTTVNCTQLIESPSYGHSCNETRRYGPSSFIYAQPVFGATQYEFRIFNTGEGYDETYVRNTYILELFGFANPLLDGYSYQVQVRARVSDTWGSFCGTCAITINNDQQILQNSLVQVSGEATLWPNPARDGQVYLNIDGIEAATQQITVDVKDIYGQQVYGQAFGNSGERFSTVLNLPADIASGVYLVNITVNGEVTTKRLSIVR